MLIEKGWLDICCLYIVLITKCMIVKFYSSEYDNEFFFENQKIFDCMIYYVFLYNGQDDQLIGLME